MRKYENRCVGCPKEMGCLGNSCRYRRVPVDHCDICDSDEAEYNINGEDFCEDCARSYLLESFKDLTVREQARALDILLLTLD